jgi:phosphate acetyltransferase
MLALPKNPCYHSAFVTDYNHAQEYKMSFIEVMKIRARENPLSLVLPEGTEPRTIKAAQIIAEAGLASSVTLLGEQDEIAKVAACEGCSLEKVKTCAPETQPELDAYAQELFTLRKHKGMSLEEARTAVVNPLNWGAMMVRMGDAQAMVAGAENSTANVLRAALTIIGTSPGTKVASSCFVMHLPDSDWGVDGHLVFSDCATVPDPDPVQLSEIAISAAHSCQTLLRAEPIVALLSFSTKGSASHPQVDKVIQAAELVHAKKPNLKADGELQLDAALLSSIGSKKAPGSPVAGKANVLIFPDLNAGNIGYKLVQRLAGARAYGPFLQGFAKPVSDLSRGCSVDDIVNTSAVTLVQAQKQ